MQVYCIIWSEDINNLASPEPPFEDTPDSAPTYKIPRCPKHICFATVHTAVFVHCIFDLCVLAPSINFSCSLSCSVLLYDRKLLESILIK